MPALVWLLLTVVYFGGGWRFWAGFRQDQLYSESSIPYSSVARFSSQ